MITIITQSKLGYMQNEWLVILQFEKDVSFVKESNLFDKMGNQCLTTYNKIHLTPKNIKKYCIKFKDQYILYHKSDIG